MFQPGERVIALGALTQSAGAMAGFFAGALSLWLFRKPWYAIALGSIAAGLFGLFTASIIAKALYSSSQDQITIAKLGVQSLVVTIPAGLAGAVSSATLIGLIIIPLLGSTSHMSRCVVAGVCIGFAWALLGSLL